MAVPRVIVTYRNMMDIATKIVVSSVAHGRPLSAEFCKNWLSSSCVILLINKQTNADEKVVDEGACWR